MGDVCRTPADEAKSIVPIHQMTSVLARNLVALLSNGKKKLEAIPAHFPCVYFINFGQRGDGVLLWNDFVLLGHSTGPLRYLLNIRAFKILIEWLNMEDLRGGRVASKVLDLQYWAMDLAFWIFSLRVCRWLPCGERRDNAGGKREEKRALIKGKLL